MTSTITINPTTQSTISTGAVGCSSHPGSFAFAGTSASPSWASMANPVLTISDTAFTGSTTPSLAVKGRSTFEGDAEFKGDLKVDGVSIVDALKNIEGRLNILRVDTELEERWERLKKLGDEYRALEAECLDKELIIKILKE